MTSKRRLDLIKTTFDLNLLVLLTILGFILKTSKISPISCISLKGQILIDVLSTQADLSFNETSDD